MTYAVHIPQEALKTKLEGDEAKNEVARLKEVR